MDVNKYNFNWVSNVKVWLFYLLIVGVFLLQQPLQGSLMGNWDNWLYLFLFNYYPDYFSASILNEPVYGPFYPDSYPAFLYGEPSFFSALIYLPLQWLLGSEIWAFYVFTSIVLSLNAFAVYLLFKQSLLEHKPAVLAGLLFVFSNFVLCSLDQQNVLSVYPGLFSIYFIIIAAKNNRTSLLVFASLFAGVQLYCSGYNFLFTGIVWGLLGIVHYRTLFEWLKKPFFWIAIISLVVYITPFYLLYFMGGLKENSINTVSDDILIALSLHAENVFQTHPYNIIYGSWEDSNLIHYIGSVGLGVMSILLAIFGLTRIENGKLKATIILIIITGFLLALGPQWNIGGLNIESPVFMVLSKLHLDQYMRTPVRVGMISLVVICMLSAYAISKLAYRNKFIGVVVLILWCLENIPYQLQKFPSHTYIEVPDKVWEAVNKLDVNQVLWIQPSSIHQQVTMPPGLGEINREYIYMFWQTQFKKNMVNGMNGYYPKSTMNYRELNKDNPTNTEFLQVYVEEMELRP